MDFGKELRYNNLRNSVKLTMPTMMQTSEKMPRTS